MSEADNKAPAEFMLSTKWDMCVERGIRKFALGAAAGTLAALVLFRSPATISSSVAFGAGTGLGMAYTECKNEFERPNRVKTVFEQE